MKNFILTLQFLTRIPININIKADEKDFAKGIIYFPIIGLIIGVFNLGIYLLARSAFGGMFPIICCILSNVMITGALHVDGLADTCDGIFSSRTKDKMLEIMKDSRIGTNGTIAIVFDFAVRMSLFSNAAPNVLYYGILLSPIASRTILVVLMQISKYARANGMGGLFIGKQSINRTIAAFIICTAILFLFLSWIGMALLFACVGISLLYRYYIYSKIGGMTGDTVGAANELIEICFIALVVLLRRFGFICFSFFL